MNGSLLVRIDFLVPISENSVSIGKGKWHTYIFMRRNGAVMVTKNDADLLVSRAFALVRACPRGRVTTYSWIATE